MSDLTALTASAIASGVAARKLSAREVAQTFLDRIAELNPALNAICTANPQALADAEACDRRIRGGPAGAPARGCAVSGQG